MTKWRVLEGNNIWVPFHSPLRMWKETVVYKFWVLTRTVKIHVYNLLFPKKKQGWGVTNTLQTDDSTLDMNTLTDGNSTTCITMSPTSLSGTGQILANFTINTSGNPDTFMVQIVTNNTNAASCTDQSLLYAQQSEQSDTCDLLMSCTLKKECMAAGFCDYECLCAGNYCGLYLVDRYGSLQSEWQLCDILV